MLTFLIIYLCSNTQDPQLKTWASAGYTKPKNSIVSTTSCWPPPWRTDPLATAGWLLIIEMLLRAVNGLMDLVFLFDTSFYSCFVLGHITFTPLNY